MLYQRQNNYEERSSFPPCPLIPLGSILGRILFSIGEGGKGWARELVVCSTTDVREYIAYT